MHEAAEAIQQPVIHSILGMTFACFITIYLFMSNEPRLIAGERGEYPVTSWKDIIKTDPSVSPLESTGENSPPAEVPPRAARKPEDSQESRIGAGLAIEGKIEGEGDVRIAGKFKGDVRVKGNLTVESGAHINGEISADTVTVGGEVEGNINASTQVRLLESGQLVGDLKAKSLTVAAGSRMRGRVEFGWEEHEAKSIGLHKVSEKAEHRTAL